MKSRSLNLLEPSGPVQACNGIALPLPLSSGHSIFTSAGMWGALVTFRSCKWVHKQKCLGNTGLDDPLPLGNCRNYNLLITWHDVAGDGLDDPGSIPGRRVACLQPLCRHPVFVPCGLNWALVSRGYSGRSMKLVWNAWCGCFLALFTSCVVAYRQVFFPRSAFLSFFLSFFLYLMQAELVVLNPMHDLLNSAELTKESIYVDPTACCNLC